ncbi:hypothetical protein ACTFIW_003483 [Dictyostelium discoideum]
MKNFILLVFLFLLVSNSLGKSNKKDDQSPEIVKINSNDHLPLYYEIIISGHFSIDKTGLTVTYLGDKIHDFEFIKGQVLNVTGEPHNNPIPTVSINPDQLNDDEFEVSDNSDFSKQTQTPTPTSKPTSTPTQTIPPPTTTPKQTIPPPTTTPKPTSTPSETVPPQTTTPTPTSTPKPTSTPTQTIPPTTTPKPTKSSKPTKTPIPTPTPTRPSSSSSVSKGYDIIKFNITDIDDIEMGKITISYKNGQSSSKHFQPNSIIKSIERANSVGGVVEFKGSFFYTDDYEPNIKIGNKICETLTSSQTSIRCYLTNGTGCGYTITIDNLLNPIDNNGNPNLTYCYANPIIDKVIGYKDKKLTLITIIGKNFLNNPTVIIEKPNGNKRNCSNVILSTDTLFICELSKSYHTLSSSSSSSPKTTNTTMLSFINNSPNSTVSNEIIEMISGYFQIKISTKPSTTDDGNTNKNNDDDGDSEIDSVGKSAVDSSKSNNNNGGSGNKKLYLLIILPTVLFIIVAALVAIFIKTRVSQNSGSKVNNNNNNKKDSINVPFQMLDEITT